MPHHHAGVWSAVRLGGGRGRGGVLCSSGPSPYPILPTASLLGPVKTEFRYSEPRHNRSIYINDEVRPNRSACSHPGRLCTSHQLQRWRLDWQLRPSRFAGRRYLSQVRQKHWHLHECMLYHYGYRSFQVQLCSNSMHHRQRRRYLYHVPNSKLQQLQQSFCYARSCFPPSCCFSDRIVFLSCLA
jgi:hypothetical protein